MASILGAMGAYAGMVAGMARAVATAHHMPAWVGAVFLVLAAWILGAKIGRPIMWAMLIAAVWVAADMVAR